MINTSYYKAVFVYLDVCICASSLKLFLKVNTWFPMTAWKATLWWLYILKEGVRLISNTDWLNDDQSDKITFYKEWRQFKEWDDNGHWCTKVRWRGEVDVNELENRGRSVSVCPLSAFAWMMCGPRIRMGTKKKFIKKSCLSWTCL